MPRLRILRTGLYVLAIVLADAVSPVCAPVVAQTAAFQRYQTGNLGIESSGRMHEFRIELAKTARQQAQGLMFRRRMDRDAGMLFVYDTPQIITMWMKNTYIPLDMIFIGADLRVSSIAERTIPQSLETISSQKPSVAVLEVNAGTVRRLGLKVGDRVKSAFLGGG
jgi:uncharacterized membrane protein (UPF0127 family)